MSDSIYIRVGIFTRDNFSRVNIFLFENVLSINFYLLRILYYSGFLTLIDCSFNILLTYLLIKLINIVYKIKS